MYLLRWIDAMPAAAFGRKRVVGVLVARIERVVGLVIKLELEQEKRSTEGTNSRCT